MMKITGVKRVCMYCQRTIGYKEGEAGTVTHGICVECRVEPYKRSTISHVSCCRDCSLVSFYVHDILPRCDEGKKLHALWKQAIEHFQGLEESDK